MGWFGKKAQASPPSVAKEAAPLPPSHGTKEEPSGLSREDRVRLSVEGTPADELAWIDAWLREKPGRTLEDLEQQEAQFVAVLRSYRALIEEMTGSSTPGWVPQGRLKAVRESATVSLAQIDQAVLTRGFAEISANETMKPVYKNLSLGLIRTALEARGGSRKEHPAARSSADRHNRST